MSKLAEELAQLANPAPRFDDPEDIDDGSGAKLTEKTDGEENEKEDALSHSSALRRKIAPILAEEDAKYKGKKTTRKKMHQESLFEESEDDDAEEEDVSLSEEEDEENFDTENRKEQSASIEEEEEDDSDEEEENLNEEEESDEVDEEMDSEDDSDNEEDQSYLDDFNKKMKLRQDKDQGRQSKKQTSGLEDGDESASGEEMDEEEEDGDEESSSEEDGSEDGGMLLGPDALKDDHDDETEEANQSINKFSKSNVKEEIAKGKATKCQLGLWDSVLENRIKLQKVLVSVNQLPQQGHWDKFVALGGEEYHQAASEAYSSMKALLDQLVLLQTTLLLQNSETKHVVDGSQPARKAVTEDDDEEITSEEEEDEEKQAPKATSEDDDWRENSALKRKIKVAEYPEFLAKRQKKFEEYRNETIQKWYDKTRVATGKINKSFAGFEQSALKQIEQILCEKDRLIKRTQLKRSAYRVLGQPEKKEEMDVEEERSEENTESRLPTREHLKDYDAEIFDDDDFYHQLLRELIERKASDMTDPIAISRQWLEIQKLRTKSKKKKVDTKASKGRKIRYHIHPKLVNFMAPVLMGTWTDEAKNELYSSLFGQGNSQLPVPVTGR